ncbi:P-loop containing nucleoside triphosphate hydrolase protein [Desarmillaria tabescens]|uniref:P-loop containing nucleoside triphosphate hydrolase protein n=1 Tax=Armillaria tabescens TaxID=1929756 RepID=A0AA39N7K9_ARMTA|nr:P-loop containing nucleoside triphosphate hydrolase protein [Desarmillaria tabescens]KAK0460501.1 P-loop containing nucleoside triphosphate hydrolase protein [Desarmillaria tabescens]
MSFYDSDSDNDARSSDPGPEEGGVGLANPALSQSRRRLLDLINRLHSTGAQVDIDLPQIAVIGSQSAGKSSLIESISGITLPRATGTCTRCPTECRLANSSDIWKCIVSLRFIKDVNGQLLGTARNEHFGETIYDKAEVEERIRRAQRAILNPNRRSTEFLEGDDEDLSENQLSFSTNCVSLQITGPGVADLSFCDLPGLIASVGSTGNKGDIMLVKTLVESYISKPSCLILLTVACETDFENQGAHHLAKTHDPEGKRTIGVLTKPDRIPPGDETGWLDFIRNEREPLENNWYCVKQPSSSDIKNGITWAEARTKENEFFSMTAPWADLDPMYQRYLRTVNLVERLSNILSDLISKRLPDIQLELERAVEGTLDQLAKLPKEPSKNPLHEISALLSAFTMDVSKHVEGIPDEEGILQSIGPAQERFKRDIRGTAPQFRPFERNRVGTQTLDAPLFLSNEEDETEEGEDALQEYICVDEVHTRALHARTRELPGHFPFVVQASYIFMFTDKWHTPAKTLCRAVYNVLTDHVNRLITQHFGSFGQNILEQRVRVYVQEHLKKQLEQTEARIEWLVKLEARPYTLNTHYLSDYTEKFLAYYKAARGKQEHGALVSLLKDSGSSYDTVGAILSGLDSIGIHGVEGPDLAKLLPADRMEASLKIMADVRAYFQVAYKRFADNIPLAIDYDLVRGVDRGLLATLSKQLGIYGANGQAICKEFAQESPQVAGRREELTKKLERLQSASEELMRTG